MGNKFKWVRVKYKCPEYKWFEYHMYMGFSTAVVCPDIHTYKTDGPQKCKWHGWIQVVPARGDFHSVFTPKKHKTPQEAADNLIFELRKHLQKYGLDLHSCIRSTKIPLKR